MFKVIRLGATPVGLSLFSIQVYAASSEKETSKKELLKVEELSLYSSPACETKYVENPQTQLEEGVSHLRHVMEPYTVWCQDLYAQAMPKLEKAVERGRETYEFLQNPPAGFYPRLGVIGFAGIIGLFLARGTELLHMMIFSKNTCELSVLLKDKEASVSRRSHECWCLHVLPSAGGCYCKGT
ncbi:MICOS complex subunit MIC26 isoform 7-T18 [Amazona ochrocephala]